MMHIRFPEEPRPVSQTRPPCPAVQPTSRVLAVMRLCARDLGLSAQVLRSLEVLLSCLAPQRNHHVVFASNATLVARCGGLSERSIRRHIAELGALGLVVRSDSANRKRYTQHDPVEGVLQRFGLDFAPLFARFDALSALAEMAEMRQQRLRYLRTKLRAACQRILIGEPDNTVALAARNAARRNLTEAEFETVLEQLPTCATKGITAAEPPTAAPDMAGTGGQNDRHQSSFSKEHIDEKEAHNLDTLLTHCSEAQSLSPEPLRNDRDVVEHAARLAPMIGIPPDLWRTAANRRRELDLAALVWMMVQNLRQISKPAAYFQAVTIGRRASQFAPWEWLRRQAGVNCPRTTG